MSEQEIDPRGYDWHIKIHEEVGEEREYQLGRWGRENDAQYTPEKWCALIQEYASQGRFIEAAALCEAAAEFSYLRPHR